MIEFMRSTAYEFDFVTEFGSHVADNLVQPGVVQALDHLAGADLVGIRRREQMHRIVLQMEDPLQVLAHADGPGDGCAADLEDVLDLVHQLDGIAPLAVELVDEGHDRGVAQAADLHQLDGPLLDALGAVDDHQRGIDRRQGAVGILGEVLVTGGVEQVDDAFLVGELHHRGSDRDAALLLHLHPVGSGMASRLSPLDSASKQNGLAEQQHLLGDRGFSGVGVGDDGEGSSAFINYMHIEIDYYKLVDKPL